MRNWILVFLLFFLTGCVVWQATGGPFDGKDYLLDLPKGWMASTDPENLIITRDGQVLQKIYVHISDITKEQKDAKKKLEKGMLPQEASEVILDLMRTDQSLGQFTIVENVPAQIGGKEGFRLVYTYLQGKVLYKTVYYGMLQGDQFYRVSYAAPVRYYFDKDVAAFEEIVKSLKLVEKGS
jgi:hypothetical protein